MNALFTAIKEQKEPKYKRTTKSMKEIPFEKSPLRPHFQ